VVITGRLDSPAFDDAVIDGQSGSGFVVPAFCIGFVSEVENVNGRGNCVSTDVCCACCIGLVSVVDVVGNVNGLGNWVSTDDACAGSMSDEVVFRYLRTGPARLCCTHSATVIEFRNENILFCDIGAVLSSQYRKVLQL
jgi:hypothetical protein